MENKFRYKFRDYNQQEHELKTVIEITIKLQALQCRIAC